MHFANPNCTYLLALLPILVMFQIWANGRSSRALQGFATSEKIRDSLLGYQSFVWFYARFGLQILGMLCIILALTRPQYGSVEIDDHHMGRNLFIAIDCSKSMLAEDVKPNRLIRAKLAAIDLLEKLPADKVGLIAFAGRAYLQAPLTNDHEALVESIQTLDHTTIPRGGSSLASAIELAVDTVEKVGGHRHGLVLFSDGQETDAQTISAAKSAAEHHLTIVTVGLGTPEGALIPDPDPARRGDYIRDNGKPVRARLEADLLREVAKITGGEYFELAAQALTQPIIDRVLSQIDRQTLDSKMESKPIERYQWPLGAGIVLLMVSLFLSPARRKAIVAAPPLPNEPQTEVHGPPPLPAGVAAPAWIVLTALGLFGLASAHAKTATEATEAYGKKQYEAARDGYAVLLKDDEKANESKKETRPDPALSYGLGAATHQLHDYDQSIRAFSNALESHNEDMQKRALRGLATSLYNAGDEALAKQPEYTIKAWTDAVSHFDTALSLQQKGTQEYKEIKENRDFVQKRLDDLEQQQQQQGKGGQQKKEQKKDENGEGEGDSDEEKDGSGKNQKNSPQQGVQKDQKKQHDALEKKQEMIPEGQIQAGKPGPEVPKPQEAPPSGGEEKRNDKTGFTPTEARSQLRINADEHRSYQFLQRREEPLNGKDY